MGHFLAPGRIPPPALALDTEAEDGEAEEIEDYAANLRFALPIGKYPLFLEKRMLGVLLFVPRIYSNGFVRHRILLGCRHTSARSHGHGHSR